MKVTKLDRRHNCHRIMKYHVEVTLDIWGSDARIERFKAWRAWCWEAFGPGCETKWITIRPEEVGRNGECQMVSTTCWAWQTEFKEMRLYFKNDETLSAFMLQWG
jgi:hypothetical protein